jgi:hypothetical protein
MADYGYFFEVFYLLSPKDFLIIWLWAYLLKVILDMCW